MLKYGLKATFYVPCHNPERPLLSRNEIKELSQNFEIGGHTKNHMPLNRLSSRDAYLEIINGKNELEQLLGKKLLSFCYPKGKFTNKISRLVEKAGFLGARTCMYNLNGFPENPFLWGVSTHAYSHSVRIQIQHGVLEKNWKGIFGYFAVHRGSVEWSRHFRYAIQHVVKHGGIAHLYLHSWEIDDLNDWTQLADVLKYIKNLNLLEPVTNGQLFDSYYDREHSWIQKKK